MTSLKASQILSIVQNTRERIASSSNVTPISIRQERTTIDPGVKGKTICVSKIILPESSDFSLSARELLINAICQLGAIDRTQPLPFPVPELSATEAEWTGHAPDSHASSEQEKYTNITSHSSETVIFYVYGGIFFTNIPASARQTVTQLCKLSGARACTVRYRLAPQNPFPAALLDILIGYLSLLYPPPGSFHSPVPAERIVFAGDSSGASLLLALTQVLLYASKSSQHCTIPLPAGLALTSPYADLAHALPSWKGNARYDVINDIPPYLLPDFPADGIWPTTPARGHIYTDATLLAHPLVSPVTAENWEGAPGMWIAVGEERLADGAKVITKTARSQDVVVRFQEYKAMPHVFQTLFKDWWQSKMCLEAWAGACKRFGEGGKVECKTEVVEVDGTVRDGDFEGTGQMTPAQARRLIEEEAKNWKPWTGKSAPKASL